MPTTAKSLVLGAIDYPPFYGKNLKNQGPLIEAITEAYRDSDYEVEIVFLPFVRAVSFAMNGEIDGIVGIWHSDERAEALLYSTPLIDNQMVFFKRKGENIAFKNYEDLKQQGYRLGSVRGYMMPEGLLESGVPIFQVTKERQTLKILSGKRVDLIVLDKDYARYALQQAEVSGETYNIEQMGPVLGRYPQHLAISKKADNAKEKIAAFERGYQRLVKTKALEKIFKKHGLSD
jgi:polar amino acid transport system substrate-binding protein